MDGIMRAPQILDIPASLWKKIGGQTATRIVKGSDAGFGIDASGKKKKHKPYSTKYKILKTAGKAAPKGVSASRQVSPPNLRLTGVMLNSISAQNATKNGVEIIFRDGLKVEGNAKRGRDIYGISDTNENILLNDLSKHIKKNLNKYVKKSIEIKIG